jgi:hypothetical protein
MIAEIRKHIKEQILRCSKSYKEIQTPYPEPADLMQNKAAYQYAIIFNPSTSIISDTEDSMDQISVTLRTYRMGDRDKLANFDEGYTNALLIKSLLLDISGLNSKEYIKGIDASAVTPAEVQDSQDVYSYETNLIFTISYGIGD